MEQDQIPASSIVSAGRFAVETTAIGLQSLVPGVSPIGMTERLAWRAAAPLCPRKRQRPLDHGLFDLAARNQLELFSPVSSATEEGCPLALAKEARS